MSGGGLSRRVGGSLDPTPPVFSCLGPLLVVGQGGLSGGKGDAPSQRVPCGLSGKGACRGVWRVLVLRGAKGRSLSSLTLRLSPQVLSGCWGWAAASQGEQGQGRTVLALSS